MTEPTVVRGNPTDEEVAAVVAALLAVRPRPAARPEGGWAGYWRRVRRDRSR
ncbi:acyl-CoA carboxylase epsilon subunit [Microlunatus sp. GCM10028923]|uniref:acyl-CoA carboxylase epsilon subunit n=1 Tax=Microlunatus sp. GCM10028923 TaxID=3273400 RepID=UPI00360626DC